MATTNTAAAPAPAFPAAAGARHLPSISPQGPVAVYHHYHHHHYYDHPHQLHHELGGHSARAGPHDMPATGLILAPTPSQPPSASLPLTSPASIRAPAVAPFPLGAFAGAASPTGTPRATVLLTPALTAAAAVAGFDNEFGMGRQRSLCPRIPPPPRPRPTPPRVQPLLEYPGRRANLPASRLGPEPAASTTAGGASISHEMHRVPLRRGSRSGEVQSVVPAAAAAFHRREPKQRTLRKTELCVWFAASGSCRFGLGCDFAHSADELRTVPRPTNWRTKTCANFVANGICPYGQRCGFLHSNAGIASTCTINKPTAPPFLTLPPASPPVRCRPTQPVVMAVPKALGRRGFINLQSAGAMASVRAERSAPAVAASAFSFAVSKPSPPLPTLPGLSPLLPTHLYSSIPFAA